MKIYIVSIYRQDEENPDALAGTVEEAGGTEKKVFHSFEGLRQILNSVEAARKKRKAPGAHIKQPE